MKKLLFCFLVTGSLIACTSTEKKTETEAQKATAIEHIYKPIYTDNFKIGGEKNVLIAEQFHKALFDKDFAKIETLLADTASFEMEDGSTIKGKTNLVDFVKKNFSNVTFSNFEIGAIIPVVGENGDQWVDIWDRADVTTPDGKTQKFLWQDAYKFQDGKIVQFLGFGKTPKP